MKKFHQHCFLTDPLSCYLFTCSFLVLLYPGTLRIAKCNRILSPEIPLAESHTGLAPSQNFVASPGPAPLLSASPIYPVLPNGPMPQAMSGICDLNISSVNDVLKRTAGDCTAPLAAYVGNVICCPQLRSMLHIVGGEHSIVSGSLVWKNKEASPCFSELMGFLVENGANESITDLCNVQSANLTGGSCPVTSVKRFEEVVDTSRLLNACSVVDPLKECCNAVCQPSIMDAAVRLASSATSSTSSSQSMNFQELLNDCESVVQSWLAGKLGPEASNSAFRILSSCKVNRACPLTFNDSSSVASACSGSSPSKSKCCNSLYAYISSVQQQMLITNVQALECVTLFGSMLKKKGVVANVYNLCEVDLKDFSLQAYGEQGCLLRSIPSDIVYDNVSGISFTCDLNDNIPAPWPASSSVSSFPLCATRQNLPALPVLDTSSQSRIRILDPVCVVLMVLLRWMAIWII